MAPPPRANPPRQAAGSSWLTWLFAWVLAAVSVATLGALALDRVAAGRAVVAVAAAVVALLPPWFFDRSITRAYRRLDPSARGVGAQVTALWNLALLAALALAARAPLGRALQSHGDWMFAHARGATPERARGAIRHLGSRLTGAAPLRPSAHDAGVAATRPVDPTHADAGVAAARLVAPPNADAGVADVAPIPTDRDLTPQEIFRLRADAVVVVRARGRIDPASPLARLTGVSAPVAQGSGFVVDGDGLVVTNEHVIHGAASVEITLRDGRAFTPVTMVAVDRTHDLALLRVDARGLPTAPVSQDDVVVVGTHATAIGSPLGLSYTLTDGLISAAREVEGTSFLQIETAIAPGSSGGPLFDPRGRVIGVTTATARAASMNFALPPRYVRALLARPRSPRTLEAFVPEAAVTGLDLEGAEASPVERMNLGGVARVVATGVESCIARAPRASRITVRCGHGSLQEVDTDLGDEGERCLGDNLRLAGSAIALVVEEDHHDELRAGHTIVVRFQVTLGAGDAATRAVTVRYEIAPGHDPDRGNPSHEDDAGER